MINKDVGLVVISGNYPDINYNILKEMIERDIGNLKKLIKKHRIKYSF